MNPVPKDVPSATGSRTAAAARWLRDLPPEVPAELISTRDLERVLDRAHAFLAGSIEAIAELDALVYLLAGRLEPVVGHRATLHCLRDALARVLAADASDPPQLAQARERIISRAGDAVWQAYTDGLGDTAPHDQRIHQELMVAKRIQQRLLPRTVPNIPGFDIAGRVLPAAELGGDYWSCKNYAEDDIVTLKLADVTGHGIAAALLVAAVKFISGGYYRGAKTAAQVMERTNNVLVRETPNEILVTMVYGWLYPHSGEMSVVNAGHSPVLHYHGGEFHSVEPTGLALGMIETRYTETRITLEPGDIFFTCSDGITEPSADARLGEEWVRDQIAAGAHLSAAGLVEQILSEALRYYRTPRDDMSILVVKRTG